MGKLTLVVLAAGLSSRCEKYKMTLPYKGKTLLQTTIDCYLDYVDEVIVVTGHNRSVIETIDFANKNVRLVYNKHYASGMYSSVVKGLKEAKGSVLLTPGDIPMIKSSTIEKVLSKECKVVKPSYEYKAGHPVFIRHDVVKEILQGDYCNLRDALKEFDIQYAEVEDEGILMDIDTLEDYESHLRRDEG